MIVRTVFLAAIVTVVRVGAPCGAQETPPDMKGASPAPILPAPATMPPEEISADEAVRRATELLDRFDLPEAGDRDRTLLDEAARFLKVVQTQQPNHSRLSYLLGRYYAAVGRQGDAIEQLKQFVATREGRTEWRAFRLLGDLFVGEFPRLAKSHYDQAAALNPNEPSVQYGLSLCAVKLGAVDDAIRFARNAIGGREDRPIGYYAHLATLYSNAGRWEEAIREAEHALQLARKKLEENPGSLGPLVLVDGQYLVLIAILQARIAQPGYAGIDDDLKLARAIRERAKIGDRLAAHQALRVVQTAVERGGEKTPASLKEQYAQLLAEVGRTNDAITVFEEMLQSDPNSSVATEWLNRLRPKSPAESPNDGP